MHFIATFVLREGHVFYTCLSVHVEGSAIPPLWDQTIPPRDQTTPPGIRPPGRNMGPDPLEGTWDQTGTDIITPGTTKASGTHPTGMLSCIKYLNFI